MKIAFCRFNQNTDLDYALGSVGNLNTDQRVGVLEAFVELGHEVTIVSHVSQKHRHVFEGECKGDFDNSWMKSMKLDIDADIQKFDILVVEAAAGNSMFSFKDDDGNERSYIGHFANVMRKAEGVPILIWHHGNKTISFPFSRLACMYDGVDEEYIKTLSPYNYRRLFKDIDIWDGYEYVLWHQSPDTEKFLKVYETYYARQEISISRSIGTLTGYSGRYDTFYEPANVKGCEYDLVYVGKAKSSERIERVKKYYDVDGIKSLVVGKGWEKAEFSENVTTPGPDKFHGVVQSHYIKGLGCVCVLDNDLSEVGMSTTRHIQSITSGCLTLVDENIYKGERLVGDDKSFIVRTPEGVLELMSGFRKSQKLFDDAVTFQQESLPSWEEIMSEVLDVGIGKNQGDLHD